MSGLRKVLAGLRRLLARLAGRGRQSAPFGSRPSIPSGWRMLDVRDVLPPVLPEPFAALLDFDALEREAAQSRQAATARPRQSRRPKALRTFLMPGVTRTEELILTASLWRTGACLADRTALPRPNGRGTASPLLILRLTERGLRVSCFSCVNYTTHCAAALPHAVSRVSTSRLTAGKDRH